MSYAAALAGEIRHELRLLVPHRFLRLALLAFGALLALAVVVAMSLVPLERLPAMSGAPGQLAGTATLALLLAVAAGIGGCVAVIRGTATVRIALAAPLPPWMVVLLPLLRPLAATLAPLALIALPLLVISARVSLLSTALVLLATLVVALGANTIVVLLAANLLRKKGPDAAVQALKASAGVCALVALTVFPMVAKMAFQPDVMVAVLVAAAILLPFLWLQASTSLLEALPSVNLERHSTPPRWGRPGWLRLAYRTAALGLVIGVTPALLVISQPDFEWRRGTLALLAVALVNGPLQHLFRVLEPVQDAWGAGPAERVVRLKLVLVAALVAGIVGLVPPLALGLVSALWVAAVGLLLLAAALTFLLPPRLRVVVNGIYLLAFFTNYLP